MKRALPFLLAALPALAAAPQSKAPNPELDRSRAKDRPMPRAPRRHTAARAADPHSYANAAEVVVRHVDLDLRVDFEKKELAGAATLKLARLKPSDTLVLDSRDLHIEKAEASADGKTWTATTFTVGDTDKILGAPRTLSASPTVKVVEAQVFPSALASAFSMWRSRLSRTRVSVGRSRASFNVTVPPNSFFSKSTFRSRSTCRTTTSEALA